jgi:hypothetical protein
MAKISLALSALLLASMSQAATIFNDHSSALVLFGSEFGVMQNINDLIDEKHMKYYMACIRGTINGFSQGLYDNSSEGVSKECLNENTYKTILDLNRYIMSGEIIQIFKSIGKFYQIGFDIQKTCRFNELSFEVTGFCLNKSNNCSVNRLIENFTNSIFKLTGAANKIAEVLFNAYINFGHEDLTKYNEASETYTELGKSIGSVTRTMMKFEKRTSSGGKRPPKKDLF